MAAKPDQLNIRVDLELKQAFIQKAKENDTSATDLLVNFMKQYLGMEVKNPNFSIGNDTGTLEARLTKLIAEVEKRLDERVDKLEASVKPPDTISFEAVIAQQQEKSSGELVAWLGN